MPVDRLLPLGEQGAGVVHEHVESGVPLADLVGEPAHVAERAEVGDVQAGMRPTDRIELLDRGRTPLGVARNDPYRRADPGEGLGGDEPEARVPAGDHDRLPGHVER